MSRGLAFNFFTRWTDRDLGSHQGSHAPVVSDLWVLPRKDAADLGSVWAKEQ